MFVFHATAGEGMIREAMRNGPPETHGTGVLLHSIARNGWAVGGNTSGCLPAVPLSFAEFARRNREVRKRSGTREGVSGDGQSGGVPVINTRGP